MRDALGVIAGVQIPLCKPSPAAYRWPAARELVSGLITQVLAP